MWVQRFVTRTQFFFKKLNQRKKIAKDKGLYRVSGLIRTACARSMRRRIGPSKPGSPPHAHTRGQGLRSIFFDVRTDHSIVGPVKFRWSNYYKNPQPQIHEFGKFTRNRVGYYYNFPERSFMYSTVRKLARQGKISRKYRITIGRSL